MEKDMISTPKIIIVDDDRNTCETLVDILTLKKFQTGVAHNGKSALAAFREQVFDAAILDIKLPDMDGLRLLEKLQEIQPNIIALFVTGHASVDYARKAITQGAKGFFVKPLIIEEVLHVLNEALEKQELARRYEERSLELQNIICASNDAIFSIDESGRIWRSNTAAEHIFGYSADEFSHMGIFSLFGQEKGDESQDTWEEMCGNERSQEVKGRSKQGNLLYLEISIGPYWERAVKMFSLIIRDVSARKKDEEKRKQLHVKIAHASKMEAIGTLAGGIAHDFNNILTSILGYSQMVNETLEEGSLNRQDMGQVINAGLRAKELVRQILSFSRKSEESVQPVQASTIVKEVLSLLRSSIPKSIEIVTEIKNKTSLILINPVQLHQVVMNLCVNACHAMPEGGRLVVKVEAGPLPQQLQERFPHFDAKEYLEIVVHDSGTGIDPSVLERIFEPYFTTKKMEEGTGLGLSTAHGIVTALGGEIRVETEVGKGCTFSVYLPTIDIDGPLNPLLLQEEIEAGCEHILFVDDEMPIAELGKRNLEQLGYKVTSFFSSEDVLEAFQAAPETFDVLVTNYSMPKMTGVQLAKEIHKIRPEMPVILTTGFVPAVKEEEILHTGIKVILTKPISRKRLAESIREIIDEKK